jgi:predicted RNA methylase
MPKQVNISPEVRQVLAGATVEGTASRPVVLLNAPQLARPLYEATDKVLRALGGKWDRRARGHVFDRPVEGQLADALRSGVAVDAARTAEQFFTPPHVARSMAVRAGIVDATHVLEPSAGSGALVEAATAYGATVTAIERDPLLLPALRRSGDARLGHLRVYEADFMTWTPPVREEANESVYFPARIDVVLMNPPFSRGTDAEHVTRALGFLAPGGVLVSVMSPHYLVGQDRRSVAFRELIGRHDTSWDPLPDASFRASGTDVATGILTVRKGEN